MRYRDDSHDLIPVLAQHSPRLERRLPARDDIVNQQEARLFVDGLFIPDFEYTADIASAVGLPKSRLFPPFAGADQQVGCKRKTQRTGERLGKHSRLIISATVFTSRMQRNRHQIVGPKLPYGLLVYLDRAGSEIGGQPVTP